MKPSGDMQISKRNRILDYFVKNEKDLLVFSAGCLALSTSFFLKQKVIIDEIMLMFAFYLFISFLINFIRESRILSLIPLGFSVYYIYVALA